MKKLITKLRRFLFGPQIGDVYVRNDRPVNPFQQWEPQLVEIVDKRDGWVQIKYMSNGSIREWSVKMFQQNFIFDKSK
jgi:hypothetical protein